MVSLKYLATLFALSVLAACGAVAAMRAHRLAAPP